MKNLLFFLFFSLHFVDAKVTREFYRWAKGDFEIPPEIKKAKTISEVQPFLKDKDEFTRTAAVRRLGEIEGEKVIDLLIDVFNKEGYRILWAPEGAPLVKLEIIRTLGRMDGNKAKSTLLSILKTYWKEGPRIGTISKRYYYLDGDFTTVVPLAIETISKWILDDDVFQLIKEIAFSEEVRKIYTTPKGIGENAWKAYLKGKIKREKPNEKDAIKYLFDFIDEVQEEKIGKIENERDRYAFFDFKNRRIEAAISLRREMMKECSENTLLSLKKDFEQELEKESRDSKRCVLRYHEIKGNIDFIERILEERKKK